MERVLAIILGGGRGTRLFPLTKHRAKPALPLAGQYRLIDIPVSNCINSRIQKIYVLTQFNSASLNQHIANTYRFSPFSNGFVHVLAAQQTPTTPDWFQGTADAVRKTLWMMESWQVDQFLVLAGDHLYRMDYRPFVQHHRDTKADITVSVVPVDATHASSFGLLKTDGGGRITEFREKPEGAALQDMKVVPELLPKSAHQTGEPMFIASMGIYVFNRQALLDLLEQNTNHTDFGKHVIPWAINQHRVQSYVFDGYWEDIGTVESFYHANMELVKQPNPKFSFFDTEFPIFTRPRFLPPSKIQNCQTQDSIICDGCLIMADRIKNSIIGIRSRVDAHAVIENTLVMGADFYQSAEERAADIAKGVPPVGIGANSVIRKAIIDKNVRIGKNVRITNERPAAAAASSDMYSVVGDIVVVTKDVVIPDGTVI